MVLDASVAIAWVYGDELTAAVAAVKAALDRGATAWVPSLWTPELSNVLTIHVRKKRLSFEVRDHFLNSFARYDIRFDQKTAEHAWGRSLQLADKHNLTTYDASYLELALRLRLPLATLDVPLRNAARYESVPLLGI